MDAMTLLPRGREFTREDLDAMPDDGNRYQLIDGAIIVTPAPRFRHQDVIGQLYVQLRAQCPQGLVVVLSPFDVALADDTVVQPDLIVTRVEDLTDKELPVAPLLAIEVLSPSTRGIDLVLKRERYQRAGVATYWVVDPVVPRMTVFTLVDGRFEEETAAEGGEPWHTEAPFALTLIPAQLRDVRVD